MRNGLELAAEPPVVEEPLPHPIPSIAIRTIAVLRRSFRIGGYPRDFPTNCAGSSTAPLGQLPNLSRIDLQHHAALVDRLDLRRVDEAVAARAGTGVEDDSVEDVGGAIAQDPGDAPDLLPFT